MKREQLTNEEAIAISLRSESKKQTAPESAISTEATLGNPANPIIEREDKPYLGFLDLYDIIDGWYHTQTRHHLADVDADVKDNLFEPLMAAIEQYAAQQVVDELKRVFIGGTAESPCIEVELDGVGHPSEYLDDRIASIQATLTNKEEQPRFKHCLWGAKYSNGAYDCKEPAGFGRGGQWCEKHIPDYERKE